MVRRVLFIALVVATRAAAAAPESSLDADQQRLLSGKTVAYWSLELASPGAQGQRTGGLGILAQDLARGLSRTLAKSNTTVYGVTLGYDRTADQEVRPDGQQVLVEKSAWIPKRGPSGEEYLVSPAVAASGRIARALGRPNGPGVLVKKGTVQVEIEGRAQRVDVYLERQGRARIVRLMVPGQMLYGGDRHARFWQELVLARAGAAALQLLGVQPAVHHFNESHTGFAAVEVQVNPYLKNSASVSTTHTPVAAGLERFDASYRDRLPESYKAYFPAGQELDLTDAMMRCSTVVNGVSREHAEVMKRMYPQYADRLIANTNGVDPVLWQHTSVRKIARAVKARLNAGAPLDHAKLRNELWQTKAALRRELVDEVARRAGVRLDPERPILAFTRRVTGYKNTKPLLEGIIKEVCRDRAQGGLGFQVVVAGVSHPNDGEGQSWIKEFNRWTKDVPELRGKFVFVPNYLGPDTDLAFDRKATQGADVWLSSPLKDLEACGTSDQRSLVNLGIQLGTPNTAGWREYVRQGKNGFYILPYNSQGLKKQLTTISDMFYEFQRVPAAAKARTRYAGTLENIFRTSRFADIKGCAVRQIAHTYLPAMVAQQVQRIELLDAPQGPKPFTQAQKVRAAVTLGLADPRDLNVEIWAGTPTSQWAASSMHYVATRNGKAVFEGQVEPLEPGTLSYTARVRPRRGTPIAWAGAFGQDRQITFSAGGLSAAQVRNIGAQRWAGQNLRRLFPLLARNEVKQIVEASGADVHKMISLLGTYPPGSPARSGRTWRELAATLENNPNAYRPKIFEFTAKQKQRGLLLKPGEPVIVRNAARFTALSNPAEHDPDVVVSSAPLGKAGEHLVVFKASRAEPGNMGKRGLTFRWPTPLGTRAESATYPLRVEGKPFAAGRRAR